MDVHKEVFLQVDKVVVDDWNQCNREKKIIHQLTTEGRFSREQLHAELGEIVSGKRAGRETNDEIILLNPIGIAIEDVACAQRVYLQAQKKQIGTWLSLY
jgi:ornithine cyclodeaminase